MQPRFSQIIFLRLKFTLLKINVLIIYFIKIVKYVYYYEFYKYLGYKNLKISDLYAFKNFNFLLFKLFRK